MEATATSGKKSASTRQTRKKPHTATVEVPVTEINGVEGMSLGFRQEIFALDDGEKNVARVSSTGGLGGFEILMEYGDKTVMINGLTMLRMWVETFDPKGAARFPGADGR